MLYFWCAQGMLGHAGAMPGPCRGNVVVMIGPCWGHAGAVLGQRISVIVEENIQCLEQGDQIKLIGL